MNKAEADRLIRAFSNHLMMVAGEPRKPWTDSPLSTLDLEYRTGIPKEYWEERRRTGDSPPYLTIHAEGEPPRYRYIWMQVLHWMFQDREE